MIKVFWINYLVFIKKGYDLFDICLCFKFFSFSIVYFCCWVEFFYGYWNIVYYECYKVFFYYFIYCVEFLCRFLEYGSKCFIYLYLV